MIAWVQAAKGGVLALGLLVLAQTLPVGAQTSDLVSKTAFRVCADPANFPMSDSSGAGFENQIAKLFAQQLDVPLEYIWYPMSTGFIRNTLGSNKCDVVIGYAQGHELVLNTNHYLVSAYGLVVPKDGPLSAVTSLSDPALAPLRIGVVAGSPPATHMAHNGLIAKAKGYPLFVDSRYETPIPDMLADLKSGEIDAAVIWGPLAGPLVQRNYPEFQIAPLLREAGPPRLFFRITMGVRKGETVWKRKLNSLIRRNQTGIDAILSQAGVPLISDMGDKVKVARQ